LHHPRQLAAHCQRKEMSSHSTPLVSVVMSVLNGDTYLSEAVESILGQTFLDFEFIITDDGSHAPVTEILIDYSRRDNRIRLLRNERSTGLTKALNAMIRQTKGAFIARMDGDDISLPNRLEHQVHVFFDDPRCDIVYTDTILIGEGGQEICRSWRPTVAKVLKVLPYHNYIPHPSVMMRKDTLVRIGMYDESFKAAQDTDLWIRLRDSGSVFHYIPEPLLKYRLNPNSVRAGTESDRGSVPYRLAHLCIWNSAKFRALAYWSGLNTTEKLKIILKSLIPSCLLRQRSICKKRRALTWGRKL
jgi:glycosyltransferase involved in cell wall biosynthesis